MGQKSIKLASASVSHAIGRRSGTPRVASGVVYSDYQVRELLKKEVSEASVKRIQIERAAQRSISPSTRRVRVW
jgi:ribosomal protein S3